MGREKKISCQESNGVGQALPGFKDLHLAYVCVPSVLVIGEDADLKEKGLDRSAETKLHYGPIDLTSPHVPSFFVISMSTHSSGSSRSKTLTCLCVIIVYNAQVKGMYLGYVLTWGVCTYLEIVVGSASSDSYFVWCITFIKFVICED